MDKKRKIIDLLPAYLRTETLRKVFDATVDHLFQPESVDFLTGYVGIKPPWYNSGKDFYLSEPSKNRQDYQLSPTVVSRNFQSGQITDALFYDDLINQLRFQGALTNNHSRLFDEEYYSWSPPIDLDKFVNFTRYYWLPSGPYAIELLDTTDLENLAAGQTEYTYTGWVRYTATGEVEETVLKFTSGLAIIPLADKTLSLNGVTIFVEGVGRSIYLYKIPAQDNPGWDIVGWDNASWDTQSQYANRQYVTIARTSVDNNQWTATNRWFHIDVIIQSRAIYSDTTLLQARRPIIEFFGNIELYDYGTRNRGQIDIVDTNNGDLLGSIVGQPSWSINSIPLRDGMKIMGISPAMAQSYPAEYGRIYIVSGVTAGNIQLILDIENTNGDGAPRYGDRAAVTFGQLQGYNIYYDGQQWISTGQQKIGTNAPLFTLYDIDGISMNDPSVYLGSSFAGSKVFSYQTDVNSATDEELGINPKLDQFGDYVFSNDLVNTTITYVSDGKPATYNGYLFAKISDDYLNSWNIAPEPSRQYIINNFVADGVTNTFTIDQTPAPQLPNTLPTIFASLVDTDGNEIVLKQNQGFSVSQNIVSFDAIPANGTRITIRSWSKQNPDSIEGYYEIPKNLSANPNNQDISVISRSQFLQQFVEIINNQTGLVGNALGNNNYRDTAQVLGLGTSILQHRAPMLKLGVLNSTEVEDVTSTSSKIDPMLAMQYAQRSYQRFYNRFLQALFSQARLLGGNISPSGCDPTFINQMVTTALQQINIGKTVDSPWANSGPGGLPGSYCSQELTNPTYVPATATRLGITPAYHPIVYMDTSYTVPQMVIQCHDGSRIVMVNEQGEQLGTFVHGQTSTTNPEELTNSVAAAWLKFELDLYNNLPAAYRNPQAKYVFDVRTYLPGKWRQSDYTFNDVIRLQRASFDRWTIGNQIEWRVNTGYDTTNQFSYNYRSVVDKQGQPIPGHWQGIYRWFYDTDRPHTHPWEMLGFSQMPPWWEDQYGPAPYTSGNTALWSDLSQGIIRQGPRAGTYSVWARPGLLSCIPVDTQGVLLPPYLAGCVASIPDVYSASSEWQFGDGSPVETAWIHSQEYPFVTAQTGYLTKPARFVEYNWDTLRTKEIYENSTNSQWLYIDTNTRRSSNQFYVHRERPNTLSTGVTVPNESNLSYFGSCGFQHWISEYLISQGLSVTEYFGNIIRGGNVQLAHRMAGYINADSLRTMVDSFGDIGYQSQIIPNDNLNVVLYRSTSIGEAIYSGVLIEQVRDGWKLYGYDSINQVFPIIPSDTNGPKNSVIIGTQRAIEYLEGLDTVNYVPYSTIMPTRQMVYDFLISYGRYLKSQGWVFDQYSDDANVVLNWNQSAKEFLFWSQGGWENGTFISVSPSAASTRYVQEYGNIQYVNGIVAGAYPVTDRAGLPIQPQNITTIREEGSLTIRPTNTQGIFGLRLYRTTLEHAVFWDNTTGFGDIIYQPLYDLRQSRIKIYAYRSNDWNGRVDAPGYILTQNTNTGNWTMVPNYDATSNQITKYYNIEQPKNYTKITNSGGLETFTTELGAVPRQNIQNLARHMLGYQNRLYLQNLLLEDATEFEFYQGFIRNKGTETVLNRLLRNTAIIPETSSFEYYEEWLIRVGYYGATNLNNLIEYRLPQSKVSSDPQWIRLFSSNDSDPIGDDVIDIVPNDPLIVTPPESYQDKLFALRKTYKIDPATDLPLAGYPMLGETTWMVADTAALLSLYTDLQVTNRPLQVGDTIWQFINDTGSWSTWILAKVIGQIDTTVPSSSTGGPTVITTTVEHGLSDGDIIIIFGVTGVQLINGTYIVSEVTPLTFQIPVSTFEPGSGGTILVYRPTRFANTFDRDSGEPPGGWPEGQLTYVDDGGQVEGAWTVYRYLSGNWLPYRQQEYKIDSSLLLDSALYNADTRQEISVVTYFDPAQGKISGKADVEISYKTDYDPAKYNKGDSSGYALSESEAWDSAQVGEVWWDLSTVRYIDYEQGDDRYRIQHWGKIAPGTSVDIYEWIRTTIPPTDWANAVVTGEVVTENGRSYIPSGTVRNPQNPSWSQITEYGPGGAATIYYYYWVKNSAMPPSAPDRELTTLNISQLIQNPSIDNLPWYAAVSSRSIIIGNVDGYLNADKTIHSIEYASIKNNDNTYGQWELIRDGDPTSPLSDLVWNKLKASLVTFDGLGNDVPDYNLPAIQKYGTTVRPRQTWFVDRQAAGQLFVNTFNALLAASITPMVDNPSMTGWQTYFESADPIPPSTGNYSYRVESLAARDGLIGEIVPGQFVLVDPTPLTNNLWTIWQYQVGSNPWLLTSEQTYNTANFWEYVDWYLTGYSSQIAIDGIVETDADLRAIVNPINGLVIKVLNNGNNKWQLFRYFNEWILIGQQDGSIQVLDSVYQWTVTPGGFDTGAYEAVAFDKNAATEFANIIDGIKEAIYAEPNSLQLNQLFFAMIYYVVSEQKQVDWLIKTSDIILKGFNQPLTTSQLLQVDTIESIIGFINEAKPYHVKIREFVNGKSKLDLANVSVVDFDRPPGSPYTGEPPQEGTADRSYYDTYQSWNNNYLSNPELVRTLTTTLIFDRISTPDLSGAWSSIWDIHGWQDSIDENYGAMDRINEFYAPTAGMLPKVIEDLMSGVAYQGLRLSALGFNVDVGWDRSEWSMLGWDANAAAIEAYLDQIIQGGMIPNYDVAIGNGVTTTFPLLKDVTNPNDIVVWSDGALRLYGLDWYVPTYAENVEIVNGGVGYSVGDQIDIIAGNDIVATRLRVTATSGSTITGIEIVGKGSYITVLPGPYNAEYPVVYPGLGSGAVFNIDWACQYITFINAPDSSASPNIYILYIGQTFGAAPTNTSDSIYEGNEFVQPFVDANHPEELYPTRVRDTLMLDTITAQVGGRPLVSSRVYYTDGLQDQYDLLITPQTNDSVMAYLAGVPLVEGIGNDYVINFETNRLVFISTPAAGQLLQIYTIGIGGASREILAAYPATSGSGYYPGDLIALDTNMGVSTGVLQVDSVKAVTIIINNGGAGYQLDDLLVLDTTGGISVDNNLTVLRVTSVDINGAILAAVIENSGLWSVLPLSNVWNLNRIPTTSVLSADIDVSWGVESVIISVPGAYARIPAQPVVQFSSPTGSGATFNLKFTSLINTFTYVGNGVSTDFTVPGTTISYPEGIFVTVDGIITPPASRLTNGIRFAVAPAYGSNINITTFTSDEYSVVSDTSFTVTNPLVTTYAIAQSPNSTLPSYVSTLVQVNGDLIDPPLMEQFVGNGVSDTFVLTIDISAAISIDVYVDQVLQTGYTIDLSNNLTLASVPIENSDIQVVCIKTSTNYTISSSNISFAAGLLQLGDNVIVTTYTQDLDYEFHVEEFDYSPTDRYVLTKNPWDHSTIRVWLDGVIQTPGKDYVITYVESENAWAVYGNDWTGTTIIVSYMVGLPNKPSIAWRTVTSDTEVKTIALDSQRQTVLLSNVYANTSTIEIADYSKISASSVENLGYIFINDELISFNEIQLAPTMTYPNRAFLVGIQRNRLGTSGNPRSEYNIQYYNGDGSTVYFATESATQAIAETVYVDGMIQVNQAIDSENGSYEFVINPPALPAGRYVHFINSAPNYGYKNVQIASLNQDISYNNLCHTVGTTVIDAGSNVTPAAPYTWEPATNGLQYNRSNQAYYFLSRPYTG
jgi:hypothetical protein